MTLATPAHIALELIDGVETAQCSEALGQTKRMDVSSVHSSVFEIGRTIVICGVNGDVFRR